jgi:glycosyltransferase involved in cell wall biosynthesis
LAAAARHGLIFIHPSDELYGADRMLLELLQAVPSGMGVEVWLPTDLVHVQEPLCLELERRGFAVRHIDLPIMRRAYRTPSQAAKLARRLLVLTVALRRARPEVVYCTTSAAFLGAPVARAVGVANVVGHVQEIWTRSDRAVLGLAARACHRLLAISTAAADGLPDRLRLRAAVVPNATPEPVVHTSLTGRSGPLQFVVASRWNGWKGHRTLLAAWARACHPGHLVVLGGPPASGETVDVRALVAELDCPESVTVVGEVSDVAPFLDAADVVLMPSDKAEPFGLVAIEAFARDRPVIASSAGGLLDVVTSGEDGWLFPPGDVEALSELIRKLTREDVTRAGKLARLTYERRFTVAEYSARWRLASGLQ